MEMAFARRSANPDLAPPRLLRPPRTSRARSQTLACLSCRGHIACSHSGGGARRATLEHGKLSNLGSHGLLCVLRPSCST